jgi:hypothetical protein
MCLQFIGAPSLKYTTLTTHFSPAVATFAFGRSLHMWHNPPTHVLEILLSLKLLNDFSSKTRVQLTSKLVPTQGTPLGSSFLHRKLPGRRPLSVRPEPPFPRNDPTENLLPDVRRLRRTIYQPPQDQVNERFRSGTDERQVSSRYNRSSLGRNPRRHPGPSALRSLLLPLCKETFFSFAHTSRERISDRSTGFATML